MSQQRECQKCGEKTTPYDIHKIHFEICGHCAEQLGKEWLKRMEELRAEAKKTKSVADLSEQ